MCRLAYIPPGTDPEKKEVIELLSYLASIQGKDGVGVGGWTAKGEGRLVKGVENKPEASIKKLIELGATQKGVLFHCRAMTSGGRVDKLCQPFVFQNFMTVHNGHWSDWKDALWGLIAVGAIKPENGPINDSACAAALVGQTGHDGIDWIDSGVFITWSKNEKWPIVHVNRGDFAYSSLPAKVGGGIVYASSFSYKWPNKVMEFPNQSMAVLTPSGPLMLTDSPPYSKKGWTTSDGYGIVHSGRRSGGRYEHGYAMGTGVEGDFTS